MGGCVGNGRRREGWKRRRDFASPQQLDGISNIRSWNVRNAGQSDLTKKKRVERPEESEPELEKKK